MPNDAERQELLALASSLALRAGRQARDGRAERGIALTDTKSSATDMVTEFDRANEALIVGGILDARPHDAIIGEEGTDTAGTSGIDWLELIVQLIVAVIAVAVVASLYGRRTGVRGSR